MSHPFRQLDLPEAIKVIQERLWPDLRSADSIQAIADEMGVDRRTVYAWRSGETGVRHSHVKGLQALARRANIAITAESMIWGSGTRSRKKK